MQISETQLLKLRDISIQAGEMALKLREQGLIVNKKDKRSEEVTNADMAVSSFVIDEIKKLFSYDIAVCSEESSEGAEQTNDYFIIDPIDGTHFYIKNQSFTVNVARVINGIVVYGLIYMPVEGIGFYGSNKKVFKFCRQKSQKEINWHDFNSNNNLIKVSVSKRVESSDSAKKAMDQVLGELKKSNIEVLSLCKHIAATKYCYLLDGVIDLTVTPGPVYDWDIAGAVGIVNQFGISSYDFLGRNISECFPKGLISGAIISLNNNILNALKGASYNL